VIVHAARVRTVVAMRFRRLNDCSASFPAPELFAGRDVVDDAAQDQGDVALSGKQQVGLVAQIPQDGGASPCQRSQSFAGSTVKCGPRRPGHAAAAR